MKCDLCGTDHEPHQAHVFTRLVIGSASVANVANTPEKIANALAKSKYRDPEARKKYMREYMKRRRAAKG